METLTLEFDPNIKARILELLSSFSPHELKIIQEDVEFQKNKQKLHVAYAKLKNGNEKLYSVEEADAILDKIFSEYDS